MCVWSAYIGKKDAAPEVWQMGTAIEGLWSGFYTGIATLDNRRIYSSKCCGWSKYWLQKFSLADFPGKAGLFHSRTNSGGDDAWGHPFVSTNGKVAVISQGYDGVFPDMSPWAELGNELLANGKKFTAKAFDVPLKRYPLLRDGAKVHSAEVITQAVEYFYEQTGEPLTAIRKLWDNVREEGISLFLFADQPDKIYFINMNQRGLIYFTPDGAFASCSKLAFGLPLAKCTELPLNSVGYFSADSLFTSPLPDPGHPIHDRFPGGYLRSALEYLQNNPGSTIAQIVDNGIGKLFPTEGIRLRSLAGQLMTETLYSEGWTVKTDVEVPGPCGTMGLSTRFSLKN